MKTPTMITYLSRRVRLNEDVTFGWIGPDGQQIGKLITWPKGTEGSVCSIQKGLTVRNDAGETCAGLKRDQVTLLPR